MGDNTDLRKSMGDKGAVAKRKAAANWADISDKAVGTLQPDLPCARQNNRLPAPCS